MKAIKYNSDIFHCAQSFNFINKKNHFYLREISITSIKIIQSLYYFIFILFHDFFLFFFYSYLLRFSSARRRHII